MDAKLPSNTNGTLQSQGHQEVVDEHSVPRARENIAKPRFEVEEEEEYGGVIDSSFFDNNNGSDEFHDYAGKTLTLIYLLTYMRVLQTLFVTRFLNGYTLPT